MSTIHQIYCTHCTHGNSALERREGELAHRMLGYSARSGSLAAQELRRYYRQIERYVYYHLPRDTPGEEKLRLTAASAPRRLVYLPSTSGLQLIGQVCYRQTDTEGRPGSYFAHVLFRDEKDGHPRWSPLDCLKLWGAPGWIEEDSPDHPFLLQPISSLAEMLKDRRPAVDDNVFLSFLRTPAEGSFDDPAGVIPPRWRQTAADRRRELFVDAFRGFLETGDRRRESLLLVVEPSVAAMVFYGIVRLLPDDGIREGVSFSTFEPNTDRLATAMAATEFYDSRKTDLRPDAYRSRGFAINTFLDRRSDSRRPRAQYAATMVRRLLEDGWEGVDWRLGNLQSVGARRPEELDTLAAVDALASALLDPQSPPAGDDWRRSPMAVAYLRQVLGRRLGELDNPAARLESLAGGPAHLLILELIAGEPEIPGTRAAAEYLLKKLPGEKTADLLKVEGISPEAKIDVLVRYVTSHGELPPGCDHLWDENARRVGPQARAGALLLPRVLARLDLRTLEQFYKRNAQEHSDAFVVALLEACSHKRSKRIPLTQIVAGMDDEALLSLYRSHGPAFFEGYPQDEPALGQKLHEILGSLADHVPQFRDRLDVVLAGRHLLPDDRDEELATAWAGCRRAVLEIGRLQGQRSGVLRLRPIDRIEAATRRMAEAAGKAMPAETLQDDRRGTRKQDCLRRIGQHLLGGKQLLPSGVWQHKALWQKITWFFEVGRWPSAPLRKMCPKSRSLKSGWIIGGSILGALLVVVAIGALALRHPEPGTPDSGNVRARPETTGRKRSPATEVASAGPTVRPPARQPARSERPDTGRAGTQEAAEEGPPHRPAETRHGVGREAEQADRRAAEEAARRRDAEEAARIAAEMQAAAAEPHPPQSPPRSTGEATRQLEMAWKAGAEQYARGHAGKFFYRQPLDNGQFAIPPESIALLAQPPQIFLGEGKLQHGSESYIFGETFRGRPPAARQEIPLLAAELGLKSVYVEVQARPVGIYVSVTGTPYALRRESAAEIKRRIEPLQRQMNMIRARLTIYNSRGGSQEEKDEAYDELIDLAGIKFPKIPPRPNGLDERFQRDPGAFERAMKAYREAVAAKERIRERVIPLAMQRLVALDGEVKGIEQEYRRYEVESRRKSEEALAELKRGSRQISILVYQTVTDRSGAEDSTPARADPPPGPSEPAAARQEASIGGEFKVEQKAAQGLPAPAVARVRPLVVAGGDKPLPAWYKDKMRTGCQILEENKDAFIVRIVDVADIDVEKTFDVFEQAAAIRIRFRFFLRSGNGYAQDRRELAVTNSHVVKPVEAGKQYTIKLELTREALERLRALSADSGSGGTGQPGEKSRAVPGTGRAPVESG